MGGKSEDPNKAAMEFQKDQMKRLDALELPELEEYILQNPELVGVLEAEQLGPSKMQGISTDPALKEKQMLALESLMERSEQGVTAEDKLAMEEMLDQVGAQERSQRASIESEMQRRGTADSGASLMAKLQGSQGGANQARKRAMQMAAQGQQNRMAALQNMGQMAGQMEGADFNRQAQIASSIDKINRDNAMNRQQVAAANLASRQGIENQRANIANMQAQVKNQIAQQNFNNAYARTGAQGQVSNAMSTIAGNAPQRPNALQAGLAGAATGSAFGWPGAAVGAGLGIAGTYMEDGGIAKKRSAQDIIHKANVMNKSKEGYVIPTTQSKQKEKMVYAEDGGIAYKSMVDEQKAHDKFKKNYMKRVREELTPQKQAKKEVTGLENGGVIHAEGGFMNNELASAIGASNNQFSFDTPIFDPVSINDNVDTTLQAPEMLTQGKPERDVIAEAVSETKLAPQESLSGNSNSDSSESKTDWGKAAGLAAKLLTPPKRKKLELKQGALPSIKNNLKVMQTPEFVNLMAQQKFGAFLEDGGLPRYKQGGLYSGTGYAEDGDIMFDSNGDGAVVGGDSFERDRVDARLNSGEAVLNVAQQQRLMDLLRGEADIDDLGDEDIVEGVPMDYQQELTDEIDNGKDKKMEGLKKLLSALGE